MACVVESLETGFEHAANLWIVRRSGNAGK
jgi:hypothetical protein